MAYCCTTFNSPVVYQLQVLLDLATDALAQYQANQTLKNINECIANITSIRAKFAGATNNDIMLQADYRVQVRPDRCCKAVNTCIQVLAICQCETFLFCAGC